MKKTLHFLLYALFILATLAISIMLAKAWNNFHDMKGKVSTLSEELQNKKNECLGLHQEVYNLKNNPHEVEKVAREVLKLVKENETIYTYPAKKKKNKER